MSDTQEQAAAPSNSAAPQTEAPDKGASSVSGDKQPDGTRQYVEMPPEVQKRFNQVYGYLKQNERTLTEMASHLRNVQENADKVAQEAEKRGRERALAELKAQHKQALETANFDAAADITEKIADLKAEEKTARKPVERQAEEAGSPALPPEIHGAIRNWASEMDEAGNFKRPWAQAGHPQNKRAVSIAAGVFEDPEFAGRPGAALAEVDRLMGLQRPVRNAAGVLSDDPGQRPRTRAIGLSDAEKATALRLYDDLPPEKAIEKYREAKQKYGRAS